MIINSLKNVIEYTKKYLPEAIEVAGESAQEVFELEVEEECGGLGEGEVDEGCYLVEGEAVAGAQGVDDAFLLGGELDGFDAELVFERELLLRQGPSEVEGDVVGIACEECFVGGDEVVGAAGVGVGEASREGEDFALVAASECGGDECAAFLGGLDDDGGVAEGGDDTVASGEEAGVDAGAGGVFGDESAAVFEDVFGEGAVLGGIDLVETVTEDGDGGEREFQCGGVCCGVDAVGQSADDGGVVGFQFADDALGVVASLLRGLAGADDSHRSLGVEVGGAHDVEQGWAVGGLGAVETLGEGVVGEEERADVVFLAERQFLLGTRECRLADDAGCNVVVGAESLVQFLGRQREDVGVGVEVDQLANGGGAETGGHGEGYLAEAVHGRQFFYSKTGMGKRNNRL